MHSGQCYRQRLARVISCASLLVVFAAFSAVTFAQTREGEDFDQYSVRVSGNQKGPIVGVDVSF
jgi:hypothetical protein